MGTPRGTWPDLRKTYGGALGVGHTPANHSASIAAKQPTHRTQEEIIAQCEARYAEMEAEAARRKADPKLLYPCETCRFYSELGDDGFNWRGMHPQYHTCTQPLVMGLREHGVTLGKNRDRISLCGPEKALWEPKPSRWQRFIEWLERRSP